MPEGGRELETFATAILNAHRVIAKVFPNLSTEVERMEACHKRWRAHRTPSAEHKRRFDSFWQRCRSLLCAPCLDARKHDEASDIHAAYKRAMAGKGHLVPTLITFAGPEHPLEEADACVSAAIGHWSRFASRKIFRRVVAGYARGVELVVNHDDNTVRVLVSMLALVEDEHHLEQAGGWLNLWNEVGSKPSELALCEQPDISEPEGHATLVAFMRRVATVAIRPAHLCESHPSGLVCDAEKLAKLRAALRCRKLIIFGGAMRR